MSIFNCFDSYVDYLTNKKLQIRLDELRQCLIANQDIEISKIIIEVILKHSYPVQTLLRLNHEKKKRKKKDIDPEKQCMARTGLDIQCRRPKLQGENSRYCQSHTYSLPYNDIEVAPGVSTKIVKKRGRRGKAKQIDMENLNEDKYIPAVVHDINGTSYLIDKNDVIYKFNSNNEIVGYIKDEQVHWF